MKFWLKLKDSFYKIWKDPVWSKVIAAGLIVAIPIFWAKITNHTWTEVYSAIIIIISFKLPLFIFLSIIALYFLIVRLIQVYKNKKDPFWDEQLGNYTFKELYNIFLTETLPLRTPAMTINGQPAPDFNLIVLFEMYYSRLNTGFGLYDNIDDGGYLYGIFAPRMVGYGLVIEYQQPDDNLPGRTNLAFKTSPIGHKFHASLDKLRLKLKLQELKSNKRR